MSAFFSAIKEEKEQEKFIGYIENSIHRYIDELKEKEEEKGRKFETPDDEELRKIALNIFWNINFSVVYGVLYKIIHSLGSDKLIKIVERACDNENTPATFIIKHGIGMWYKKNLKIEEIAKKLDGDGFSVTAEKVIKQLIVDHCMMHGIQYADRQRLESKLGLSQKRLIQMQKK